MDLQSYPMGNGEDPLRRSESSKELGTENSSEQALALCRKHHDILLYIFKLHKASLHWMRKTKT
jgi:hypothetical protein